MEQNPAYFLILLNFSLFGMNPSWHLKKLDCGKRKQTTALSSKRETYKYKGDRYEVRYMFPNATVGIRNDICMNRPEK